MRAATVLLLALVALCCQAQQLKYNQTEEWFTSQRLDHFDLTNKRVWRHRYFVVADYWKAPDGPIIYNLCGEYEVHALRGFAGIAICALCSALA